MPNFYPINDVYKVTDTELLMRENLRLKEVKVVYRRKVFLA
ncbi:hypothetical protein [Nostoc sp. TCL240-02]|nr:hypothetical protein [Nostoc sp. TCL240-02]